MMQSLLKNNILFGTILIDKLYTAINMVEYTTIYCRG